MEAQEFNFDELKDSVIRDIESELKEESNAFVYAISKLLKEYFDSGKNRIITYFKDYKNEVITKEEYEVLIDGEKALLKMKQFESIGIAQIYIDTIVNRTIQSILYRTGDLL